MSGPKVRVEHVLAFSAAPSLDEHLEAYRRAGFLPSSHTARWDPGLRTGFVQLWPEYVEFLAVEDEEAFAREGGELRGFRAAGGAYGIGLYNDDTPALAEAWTRRGFDLPEPQMLRLANTPAEAPPDFCELPIPRSVLPGAACFALTSYYPDPPLRRQVWVAPNRLRAGGCHVRYRRGGRQGGCLAGPARA